MTSMSAGCISIDLQLLALGVGRDCPGELNCLAYEDATASPSECSSSCLVKIVLAPAGMLAGGFIY